jgi:hypothetical protein
MIQHHCVQHTASQRILIILLQCTVLPTKLAARNTAVRAFRPACRQRRDSRDVHWQQPSARRSWHVQKQRNKLVCVQMIVPNVRTAGLLVWTLYACLSSLTAEGCHNAQLTPLFNVSTTVTLYILHHLISKYRSCVLPAQYTYRTVYGCQGTQRLLQELSFAFPKGRQCAFSKWQLGIYIAPTYTSRINNAYYYSKCCFYKIQYWINFSVCGWRLSDRSYSGTLCCSGTISTDIPQTAGISTNFYATFLIPPMSATVAHTNRRKLDKILKTEANITALISYLRHNDMTSVAVIIITINISVTTTTTATTVTRRTRKMCAFQVSLLCPPVLLVKFGWKQCGALGREQGKVDGK